MQIGWGRAHPALTGLGPLLQARQQVTECSQTEISHEFLARKTPGCVQVYEEKICLINSPADSLGQKGYSECHCKYFKLYTETLNGNSFSSEILCTKY